MHEAVFYSEGIMSIQQNRYKMHIYLLLSIFNGKFEPVESHSLPVLVGGTQGVVVQQDLQLTGAMRVVKQGSCKVHYLFPQCLVIDSVLN